MKFIKRGVSGGVPPPLVGVRPTATTGARLYKSGSYRPSPLDFCRLSNV
jgi:hypothetical protein